MTSHTENRVGDTTPRRAWVGWRWLWLPLLIFIAARLVSGLLLVATADVQVELSTDAEDMMVAHARPNYFELVTNWDGQWYWLIAERGYPDEVARSGEYVVQNEFGFLPLYPFMVRILMLVTGLSFPLAASLFSVLCAGAAMCVIYRMVEQTGGGFVALSVIIALNSFPSTPILQFAYTEGLALLLVASVLALIGRHRYGAAAALVLLLGVTRPLAPPLGLVVVAHAWVRWRRSSRGLDAHEWTRLVALAVAVAISAVLWPLLVGLRTGDLSAYTDTLSAWAGKEGVGVGGGWLDVTRTHPEALLLVVPALLFVVVPLARPGGRSVGSELRIWGWVYPVYMLAITHPNAGLVRYLLLSIAPLPVILDPLFPTDSRAVRTLRYGFLTALVVVGVIGQYFWLRDVYLIRPREGVSLYP